MDIPDIPSLKTLHQHQLDRLGVMTETTSKLTDVCLGLIVEKSAYKQLVRRVEPLLIQLEKQVTSPKILGDLRELLGDIKLLEQRVQDDLQQLLAADKAREKDQELT